MVDKDNPQPHPLINLHSLQQLADGIRYLDRRIDKLEQMQKDNFSFVCGALQGLRQSLLDRTGGSL